MLDVVGGLLIKTRKMRDRHRDTIGDLDDTLIAMQLSTETSLPREKRLSHRKTAESQGTTAYRCYLKRETDLIQLRRKNRHALMCLMGATCTT